MIAHCFDDGIDTTITHRKALACHATHKQLATGRAVQRDVADDHVVLRREGRILRREDGDSSTGEPLADVIVGIALETERHATRHERPKTLTRRAIEADADRVIGQTGGAPLASDLTARDGTDDAIDVTDLERAFDLLTALDRRLADIEQLRRIQRLLEAVILRDRLTTTDLGAEIRLIENVAEVEAVRLPMINSCLYFKAVGATDHLIDRAETEARHDFAHLGRDEAHEIHCMLRLARKALAQTRILRRDTRGTSIQVTDAHHDAAHRYQRRRREPELLGAEQRGDDNIATGLQLAVGFDDDATAQIIEHESLMRLGEAQLPRQTGVRRRGER